MLAFFLLHHDDDDEDVLEKEQFFSLMRKLSKGVFENARDFHMDSKGIFHYSHILHYRHRVCEA